MSRRWLLFLLCLFIILTLTVGWAYRAWQHFLTTPLTTHTVIIDVKPGTSVRQLAEQLHRRALIGHPWWFMALVYQQQKTQRIQAGRYSISPGMLPMAFLKKLTSGDVVRYRITFREGWTFQQMLTEMRQNQNLTQTLMDQSPAQIMVLLGHPDQAAEGLFFPDTYYFPAGYRDIDLLRRAYDRMDHTLQALWPERAENLPYDSKYQALIVASLVEKETAIPAEKPKVAGVIARRLQKNMRLQIDPTVIYGMGDAYNGQITREDLRRRTPYNTYVINGLPPTPICMPGRAAIHAALHPAAGDELYFVVSGTAGHHSFSATLSQHRQAVQAYRSEQATFLSETTAKNVDTPNCVHLSCLDVLKLGLDPALISNALDEAS